MPVRDAISSLSVLRIVDLMATSGGGDIAQNSEPNIAFTTPQQASLRG
jgi:hypothetical protein